MKIATRERYFNESSTTFSLFPSLHFDFASGLTDNLDTGRIQKSIDIEIQFSLFFSWSFIGIIILWGDEGEVKKEELKRTNEAVYQCTYCLSMNIDDADDLTAGKCYNCGEIDYWDFQGYRIERQSN